MIRQDVLQYTTSTPSPNDRTLDEAVSKAWRAFSGERVFPIHLNDMLNSSHPTDSSSPGLPWTGYGYTSKSAVRKDASCVRSIRWFWHRIKCGESIEASDSCAYVRSHLAEYPDVKVRSVWGYPYTVIAQEMCFSQPLLDRYKKSGPIAYGYEMALGGMRKLVNRFSGHSAYYCLDFKSFDKKVPAWLIREAFNILLSNMDFTKYAEAGVPIVPCLRRAWDYLVEYFINTRIRLSDGSRYRKRSGIPSGSSFTQMVGSICNYIIVQYMLMKSGVNVDDILVFGDDSIVGASSQVPLSVLAHHAGTLGMTLNLKKSIITPFLSDIHFLGFSNLNCLPSKNHIEWITALCYPERTDHTWDDFATRALGLLYANCGVDEEFDAIARWITASNFDIVVSKSMRRYLRAMGVKTLRKRPPDARTLIKQIF